MSREMAAALIASGIDPARMSICAQSAICHARLAWITVLWWLNHA
jgi:tryptophanyl-tRNA synthetase